MISKSLDAEPLLPIPLSIKLGFIVTITWARFTHKGKKKQQISFPRTKTVFEDHFIWGKTTKTVANRVDEYLKQVTKDSC